MSFKPYTPASDGSFQRPPSSFRERVTADGSSGFKAEANRYHLYVSLACPWAHRTLLVRKLKGLEAAIGYTVVDWHLTEGGWHFSDAATTRGCQPDPIHGFARLRQVYELTDPAYAGRVTVPVLFDRATDRIVNNESSEIIRMLNAEFNEFCATPEQRALDLYPEPLRAAIDAANEWIYPTVNNGVYRCGFAGSQGAYEEAFDQLFASLDRLEALLATQRYVAGDRLTEADVRLVTTLWRFDPVYVVHFRTNKRRLAEYPNLFAYARDLYQHAGLAETVDFEHIKKHYFISHVHINPKQIVPKGFDVDFAAPHDRAERFA